MTRGRNFFPSTKEHGIWFHHNGMPGKMENRMIGTTTGLMLHYPHSNNNSHVRCPPIFQERLTGTFLKKENPFSDHDNRNALQSYGVYFGKGLGRQKAPATVNQHASEDIITWRQSKLPNCRDDIHSLYREDYLGVNKGESVKHRRYLKHHPQPSEGLIELPSNTTAWVSQDEVVVKPYLRTLANSQVPYLKPNSWRYAFHSHSHSVDPQKRTRRKV